MRQRFVERVVRERLSADVEAIATFGAFEHPTEIADHGVVPGRPEWSYEFHGRGCCLTHIDGTELDVDFDEHGAEAIDPWFYDRFLETVASPGGVEARLREPPRRRRGWMASVQPLLDAGLLEGTHRVRVVEAAKGWCQLASTALDEHLGGEGARLAWVACLLEDYVLAREVLGGDVPPWLDAAASEQVERRCNELEVRIVERRGAHCGGCVDAIAGLSPRRARAMALRELERGPIDGVMSRVVDVAAELLDDELMAAMVRLLPRLVGSDPPHPFLRVSIVRHVVGFVHDGAVPEALRAALIDALRGDQGASEGEAALLVHLLGEDSDLRRLAGTLESRVPYARAEGAAALGLLGTATSIETLRESEAPEAAAVLAWLDGKAPRAGPEPVGEEIEWRGETRTVYTVSEIVAASVESDTFAIGSELRDRVGSLLRTSDPMRRWVAGGDE